MDIRFLNDMKKVLYDQEWAKNAHNFELYYMDRGLEKKQELRYDITTIPSRMLGKEFVKTKGHEHIGKYKEAYMVLEGEAIYLMQKYAQAEIQDVYAVKAQKGDVVAIPPYYGHVSINPSNKTLKMANWVSEECKNCYDLFQEKQGACYYYTKSGWIKNKKYKNIPELRFEKPLKNISKAGMAKLVDA